MSDREVWVVEGKLGNPLAAYAGEEAKKLARNWVKAVAKREGDHVVRYVPADQVSRSAWVPVSERLPEHYKLVQFHVDGWPNQEARFVGRWDGNEWRDDTDTDSGGMPECYLAESVKFWRELPAPPDSEGS